MGSTIPCCDLPRPPPVQPINFIIFFPILSLEIESSFDVLLVIVAVVTLACLTLLLI